MIKRGLHAAHRANRWLDAKLGPPYRIVLAIGLTIEVGQHLREIAVASGDTEHIVKSGLVIVLGLALLVNTLGELYERMARREMRRQGGGRGGAVR